MTEDLEDLGLPLHLETGAYGRSAQAPCGARRGVRTTVDSLTSWFSLKPPPLVCLECLRTMRDFPDEAKDSAYWDGIIRAATRVHEARQRRLSQEETP